MCFWSLDDGGKRKVPEEERGERTWMRGISGSKGKNMDSQD
jgi:hypothetical protein